MRALPGTDCRRRIYLLRHGEVAYFDADGRPLDPHAAGLTERGRMQARAAREALREVPIDRVICSGLPRTRETATLVIGERALAIGEQPALAEIQAGRLRDIPPERLQAALAYPFDEAGNDDSSFLNGERYAELESRVLDTWNRLFTDSDWTTLLIVAHGGVNRLLLAWASGAGRAAMKAFEQDACCINIVDIDIRDGAIQRVLIKAANLTPYNPAKRALHLTTMEALYRAYRRD